MCGGGEGKNGGTVIATVRVVGGIRVMPAESIGHIPSAGCLGQSESVTAAHNKCIKGLMSDIQEAGKKKSNLMFLTMESEHTISTLWEQDGCDRICSKEELWQASQAFEMAIPMEEGRRGTGNGVTV